MVPLLSVTCHELADKTNLRKAPSTSARYSVPPRSEEHTSELQSHSDLVCRLLLALCTPKIYPLSLHDALPIFDLANTVQCPLETVPSGFIHARSRRFAEIINGPAFVGHLP